MMLNVLSDPVDGEMFSDSIPELSMFLPDADDYYQNHVMVDPNIPIPQDQQTQDPQQLFRQSFVSPSTIQPESMIVPTVAGELKTSPTSSEGSLADSLSPGSPNNSSSSSYSYSYNTMTNPSEPLPAGVSGSFDEDEGSEDSDEDSDGVDDDDDGDDDDDDDDGHDGKAAAKRGRSKGGYAKKTTKAKKEKDTLQPPRKRRSKKNPPAPTDPALPKGFPLPAILGGEMPAPMRRRRRNDMTEEEMRKKEEAGIPDSEDSDSEERRLVRLSRSTLLVMTSAQIGQYIRYLRGTFQLTKGQIEELRRQKRLVKNRESAKSSRKKREAQVCDLQERLTQMESRIEALTKENARLNEENFRLRNLIKMRDPTFVDSFLQDPDAVAVAKMIDADATATAHTMDTQKGKEAGGRSVRMATVVFLFVVFCFALFTQISIAQTRAGSSSGASHSIPRNMWKRETIPEVSRRFSDSKPWFSSQSNGRVMTDVDSNYPRISFDGKTHFLDDGQQQCMYKFPEIELSGTWHDIKSGLTIHRPKEWMPDHNMSYLYIPSDSPLSSVSAISPQPTDPTKHSVCFDIVVPLKSLRPSCRQSDKEILSRKDEVFVDVRCNVEEISIIPE